MTTRLRSARATRYSRWRWVFAAMAAGLALSAVAAAQPHTQHPDVIGAASVIDGDSIDIRGRNYRLYGIDAPEMGQFCGRDRMGQRSANALAAIINGRTLRCQDRGNGGWGRRVLHCRAADEDIQARMVREGWAYAFSTYSREYEPLEVDAQRRGLGVWGAACQKPWAWRKEQRSKETR